MRERIEDMAGLAAALREVADRVAPAQTEWWIGPFEWRGGECPVPPVVVEYEWRDGTKATYAAQWCRWAHNGSPRAFYTSRTLLSAEEV